MNTVCPNCDAEYLFQPKGKKQIGQNLRCSYCKQEWFQYNFYELKKIDPNEINSLKEMALDEYKVSKKHEYKNHHYLNKENSENFKSRLQESSERLKKSKQQLCDDIDESYYENLTFVDHSAVIGFSMVSLISILFAVLYVYSDTIENFLPLKITFLSNYRDFVDHGIKVVQDLISLSSQLIL